MYFQNLIQVTKLRQFIVTICLGPITYGASLSWTSPVLPQLQSENSPFMLTVAEGSWVGSMLALGVLCTAIPIGYLVDRFGMKRCIVALAVPNVIFTLIVMFSKDVYSLCVARFISGVAAGGMSVISPMYIADISDVPSRGILGSFLELLVFVGVILMSVCGAYVYYVTLTVIFGLFSLLLAILFLFFPESPTYLIKIGKQEKAVAALKFYQCDDHGISQAVEVICNNLQEQREQEQLNVRKALLSKPVIRSLIACVGLSIFQQLSAVDAVIFYSVYIFQETRTGIDPYTSAIILSVAQLLSAVVVVFVIEKAGRRVFLYLSAFGCGVSLAMLGVYFNLKSNNISFVGIDYVPLISLVVFVVGFALGLGPLPWLMSGELFSNEVKGVANGIAISSDWIFLFIVTKTFPTAMHDMGSHVPFYFCSICMVLCLVFVRFCVPETRGKTLDQIQKELNS